MKATLLFEDGTIFTGENFGYTGEVCGEIVFYTGVVGYQEVITDPAYRGKIVLMTYPLIGNYGVNPEGLESPNAQASAIVVKEISRMYSNWLATGSLEEYMQQQKVPGLKGIDTRAAAIHIRDHGEQKAILST
ncbi:MAG: carbamoyl-phosphate synthase domain-containing protein, partial [bacterium]